MSAASPVADDPPLVPVADTNRIAVLDVLRGFALYGVLLANAVAWYSGRAFLPPDERAALLNRGDEAATWLIRIFVDGKAMTLFAFLFGLGFAVQLDRAAARGQNGLPTYLRRLGALLVIGVSHVVLLWWGDILWGYALSGFVMVLFRKRSQRALLVWAAILVFLPSILSIIPAVSAFLARVIPGPADHTVFRAQVLDALRGHDRLRLIEMQVRQTMVHASGMPLSFIPWTLGRFLLGYAAGRSRVLHDVGANRPFFRRLLLGGASLGVVCTAVNLVRKTYWSKMGVLPLAARIALTIPAEVAYLAVAAAYVAAVALLMSRPAWARRLGILSPVGQMALTSYLTQSLICTFLFYGWGLGLMGRVGTALCIPITAAIFLAQIIVSRAWLRRFRFGPMEWLWRSLSYGKAQPMRRPAVA